MKKILGAKKAKTSDLPQSKVMKELKRDMVVVLAVLVVVLLVIGWEWFMMPQLTAAFNGGQNLTEITNLLSILGSLVILCLILTTITILALMKIRTLSKRFDTLELSLVTTEVTILNPPDEPKQTQNPEPPTS